MATYIAELRKLSTYCEFKGFLDEALRDKFVCGLRNNGIRKRLLLEKDLDVKKAIEIAKTLEKLEVENEAMRPAQNLNAHTMKPQFREKRKCYRCGSENHLANTCPHKERTCEKCKIKGHLSAVCRTGTRNSFRPAAQKFRSERLKVYYVNKFNSRDPVMVEIKVEGILMSFEIDTGSGLSIISEKTYRKFFSARKLEKSSIIVKTYSKERLNVLGFITVEAKLDSIKYPELKLLVIAGNGINLLGRNWLHVIKLNWSSIFHRHSSCNNNISGVVTGEMSDGLKKLVNKHQAIFTDELGTIKELRAKTKCEK